ncbi:hypothetical protein BDV36DRAFT_290519 [Aspergillus pseudocaelatus]|uniref:BTB domain-containing protein n=1 Tax=Aspergillus pseudocaelatus TaxID=1825620 RepID=A0ABQ6X267_9EURO|nr:hypothetical protein BDV36DRAFT_290519 [Aspergillus pseudocaelatus]
MPLRAKVMQASYFPLSQLTMTPPYSDGYNVPPRKFNIIAASLMLSRFRDAQSTDQLQPLRLGNGTVTSALLFLSRTACLPPVHTICTMAILPPRTAFKYKFNMSEKDFSQIQPADEGFSLEQIDPDGNVILLVEGRSTARFLVSSKILSMASPMFAKLFDSNFSEGIQVASSSCPTISLYEDDIVAMRAILRILHYQEPRQDNPITAEAFAILAIHCNKYDCIRAIFPWTFKWFNDLESIKTTEQYGYLLLAAHFFRSAEQFRKISARAQVQLSSSFCVKWETLEIMDLLPDAMKSTSYYMYS